MIASGVKSPKANTFSGSGAILKIVGLLLAFGLWQVASSLQLLGAQFGPAFSPFSAVEALYRMVAQGELLVQVLPSLQRVTIGLLLANLLGIPIGVLIGYYRKLDAATSVVFQFLRMISPLAWMPIAIIAFGVGNRPIYFLLAAAAIWPMIINTAHGVASLDEIWVKVAKNLGAREIDVLRRVVVPAVVPDMLTGLRLALGISWIILVPAEMLGVSSGLGYYILDSRDRFAYGELAAAILIIGAIGYVLDFGIRRLQNRFSWTLTD